MDAKLKKIAEHLLDRAADEFGNHGCNDFNLEEFGLTIDEQRALVRRFHRWNGDPDEADRYSDAQLKWAIPDFGMMRLVGAMLLEDT